MHDLALDYFAYVKRQRARHDHQTDFFDLARALGIQLAPGKHSAYFPRPVPTITLQYGIYAARYGQRVGMHEIAHHILHACGADAEVVRLHADWPGAEETLEQLCRVGATLLLLPDPMLRATRQEYGDTADALLYLYAGGDASLATVLRRWVHAESDACRAAWTSHGRYVTDAAAQGVNLPFWRHSRVPEVAQVMPHSSLQRYAGRTVGVVGW